MRKLAPLNVALLCCLCLPLRAVGSPFAADLLIVGGTESGCAAAIQAARMGVRRIVLVNDIEWLGGQFSAEGLGAIDENRAHGYNGEVPIPRSGIFRDVIDRIETENAKHYGGARRPGNTRVITTARPVVAEQVFRELLAPFEKTGQIVRYSHYRPVKVHLSGERVTGVTFESTRSQPSIKVQAPLTIDASDWGDVIQLSGADWDAGVDPHDEFQEPSAPTVVEFPVDMNPITWCLIVEQTAELNLLPKPAGYDPRYFNGRWGYMDEEFCYTSRRLVDGAGFAEIDHPDVLLINSPSIDYPFDVYPAHVAKQLEATETGASHKSIVAMTPQQRDIVFQDAKAHSLKYFYHLQQRFPKFRRMVLSEEFGTDDQLPPKPYIRESLRLVAKHVITEQEVIGFESRSNYATTMFPDAVFSWQFELDFHPTRRAWTTDLKEHGPWEADFRGHRRFGRGGTGRCVFPLRALCPVNRTGLLGAQKNLGYTSIVGSSCRLHDQSIHAGQAAGAVAAISWKHADDPAGYYQQPERLADIWEGLLDAAQGTPLVIWPFADVHPTDAGFTAIQQLALRRLLPLSASDTEFQPDQPAQRAWVAAIVSEARTQGYQVTDEDKFISAEGTTRRDVAQSIWAQLHDQPIAQPQRVSETDADGDGILDDEDPLPFTKGRVSWAADPSRDGRPDPSLLTQQDARLFNFTDRRGAQVPKFQTDVGAAFNERSGFGWQGDLTSNTRLRTSDNEALRRGFVFTRTRDVWECRVEPGMYVVSFCLGDAAHEQVGQNLAIEDQQVIRNLDTESGRFYEGQAIVDVTDGLLTLTLGTPAGGSNTCINWLILTRQTSQQSR